MAGDKTLNKKGFTDVYFGKSAVISPIKKEVEPDNKKKVSESKVWSSWGKKNDYPQKIVETNSEDTTSSGCLNFKIAAHYGQGLLVWKKGIDENGKPIVVPIDLSEASYKDVKTFLDENDIDNYLQRLASDHEWFTNGFTQLIFTKTGKVVKEIHHTDATFVRAGIIKDPSKGIEKYGVHSSWPEGPKDDEVISIDAITSRNYDSKAKYTKAVYHHKLYTPGFLYYPEPSWHSNGKYIELSSQIAIWIISNLENALNIKYHIQYPEKYFDELVPVNSKESAEERAKNIAAKKDKVFETLDETLVGEDNVGKSVYTGEVIGSDGKTMIGWTITALEASTNHEAFLPASDVAAAHIGTAHGVPPALSGLLVSKSIGAGSGSDIREAFNAYTQLRTIIARQTTLEALYLVKKINNWPDELQFGYKNIVLETLDQNPTGFKTVAQDNVVS